ncbi:PREDICTED: uncharacterized protein LOC106813343 isoform X2 [Priapulus caudatus]|uniref:Uncharacterized protein LOC106813343 isoform X2 n=1 Tax=Priapulus caudatus TaxID=37621 RepID=A0ABM1ELA4_PRICU|nr:PREDICTED: uncharacterized protein LOC106813343 isoform X2 [Priapulus caudatus]
MAKELGKDPLTYEREKQAFLDELKQFHSSRRTPLSRLPTISGREVDLHLLYHKVTSLGGWNKVSDQERWGELLGLFHLPRACGNATEALKHIYIRFLDLYEKVNFLGEDPADEDDDYESRKTKGPSLVDQVSMVYRKEHHTIPDTLRSFHGLSMEFAKLSQYDKLIYSLMSGLPNEVDFALNVCVLLSNEGKHVLRLQRCPRLLDLLLAHAGIFAEGAATLQSVYESWRALTHRQFVRFWYDTVKDEGIRELIPLLVNKDGESLEDSPGDELFTLSRNYGVHDTEGQRIEQIVVILRNLSFENGNIPVMACNSSCIRFLLLCAHCSWSTLRQMALDTLANLARQLELEPIEVLNTQLLFRTIACCVSSADKFETIRGMEVLANLCLHELNEETIVGNVDEWVYRKICLMLTVHDIMLIVYTLEVLYQLSELGEATCTNIASVHKSVEILVDMATVEAQAFGPEALVGMKVVEYIPPTPQGVPHPNAQALSQQQQQQQQQSLRDSLAQGRPMPLSAPLPQHQQKAAHMQQQQQQQQKEHHHHQRPILPASMTSNATPGTHPHPTIEPEKFACHWLQSSFEEHPGSSYPKVDMYTEYLGATSKLGRAAILNSTKFAECLKKVFPKAGVKKVELGGGGSVQHHDRLRRKHPVPSAKQQPWYQRPPPPTSLPTPSRPERPVSRGSNSSRLSTPLSPSQIRFPMLPAHLRSQSPSTPPSGQASPNMFSPASPLLSAQLNSPASDGGLAIQPGQFKSRDHGTSTPSGNAGQKYPSIQQALLAKSKDTRSLPSPTQHGQLSPSNNTSLIKSLLATKVTQNMQHRAQNQQNKRTGVTSPGSPRSPQQPSLSNPCVPHEFHHGNQHHSYHQAVISSASPLQSHPGEQQDWTSGSDRTSKSQSSMGRSRPTAPPKSPLSGGQPWSHRGPAEALPERGVGGGSGADPVQLGEHAASTAGARITSECRNEHSGIFCEPSSETGEQQPRLNSGSATSQGTSGVFSAASQTETGAARNELIGSGPPHPATNGVNGCLSSPSGSASSRDNAEMAGGKQPQNGHGGMPCRIQETPRAGNPDHSPVTMETEGKLSNGPIFTGAEKGRSEAEMASEILKEAKEAALSDLITDKAVFLNGFCESPHVKSFDSIVNHVGNGDTGAEALQNAMKTPKADALDAVRNVPQENNMAVASEEKTNLNHEPPVDSCVNKSEVDVGSVSCNKVQDNCRPQMLVGEQSKCDVVQSDMTQVSENVTLAGCDKPASQHLPVSKQVPINDFKGQVSSAQMLQHQDFHKHVVKEEKPSPMDVDTEVSTLPNKLKQKSCLLGELLESTSVEKPPISLNINSARAAEKKTDSMFVPVSQNSAMQGFIARPAVVLPSRQLGALPGQLPQPYVSVPSTITPTKRPSTEPSAGPNSKRPAPPPFSQRNVPSPMQISSPPSLNTAPAPHSPILKLALEKSSAVKGATSPRRAGATTPKSVPKMPVATCSRPAATKSNTSQSNTHSSTAAHQRNTACAKVLEESSNM